MDMTAVARIDFLPAEFHARQLRQRSRKLRWSVAGAVLLLIGLGLIGNHLQRKQLVAEYERLKPQAAALGDLERQLAAVHSEIDTLGLRSNLRSHLRLRPATTRLLAATTSPMPADLAMTEFHVGTDQPPETGPASATGPGKPVAMPPVQKDLERLAGGMHSRRMLVTVRGVARNDAVVSDYLSRLREAGLFDEVRLLVTDRYEHRGLELRSFAVQLRVRQPGTERRTAAVPVPASTTAKGNRT